MSRGYAQAQGLPRLKLRMKSLGAFEVLAYVTLAGKAVGPGPNPVTRMELSAARKKSAAVDVEVTEVVIDNTE